MQDLTLILEGGALRSLYTSGVLDVLMKYNILVTIKLQY